MLAVRTPRAGIDAELVNGFNFANLFASLAIVKVALLISADRHGAVSIGREADTIDHFATLMVLVRMLELEGRTLVPV
jgi:hypothetical protein